MAKRTRIGQRHQKPRGGVSAQGMVLAILAVWTLAAVGMTMGLAEAVLAALVVWLVGSLVAVFMKVETQEPEPFVAHDEELLRIERRLFDAIVSHPDLSIDIDKVEASLTERDTSGSDVFRQDLGVRMRALLGSCHRRDRSVVVGYFIDGKSEPDLSKELGMGPAEVERVVIDAVERLCEHVSREQEGEAEPAVVVTEAA